MVIVVKAFTLAGAKSRYLSTAKFANHKLYSIVVLSVGISQIK